MKKLKLSLGLILFQALFVINNSYGYFNNLHLIDRVAKTGFEIYRYSAPDAYDMRALCRLGIDEVMVLSGTASEHEYKYSKECPNLKVIYNKKQDAKIPVARDFLNFFDDWVTSAQKSGKKIAFRCECGCHRTGRLAAYYQMKYQNLEVNDAIALMYKYGKFMYLHPELVPQVKDLNSYIEGLPCTQSLPYCVRR